MASPDSTRCWPNPPQPYSSNMPEVPRKIIWNGVIRAVQPRAWVWRYKLDNRTHHLTGFNLWLGGEVDGAAQKFSIAISGIQQGKLGFQVGDTARGTAWPVQGKKREVVDYYRAGSLRLLLRTERHRDGPPFTGSTPAMEDLTRRGCRMLDAKLWRAKCFTCIWANRSRVEIEYDFDRPSSKRYRDETFCYGPRSCPVYEMGPPRQVPYKDSFPSDDTGWMDDICISERGDED